MAGKPIYILGVNSGENATAALLKDGKIIACVSEERFCGEKNYCGIPYKSISFLLEQESISGKDITLIATTARWRVPLFGNERFNKIYSLIAWTRWNLEWVCSWLRPFHYFLHSLAFRILGGHYVHSERKHLAQFLGVGNGKIISLNHHLTHAAAAYYGGPFAKEDALVFTADAEGDLIAASIHAVRNGKWEKIATTPADSSLGWIYYELTGFLGMKKNEHEYKVMGLAPYAKEYGVDPIFEEIKDIIFLDKKNPLRFRSQFDTHLTGFYLRKKMRAKRFDHLAGAFQKLVEVRLQEWIAQAIQKTGIRTICFAGGVAMNVKANMQIAKIPAVEKLYFCPSPGDESTPIGACYLGFLQRTQNGANPLPLNDLYFGPSFTNREIEAYLQDHHYFQKYNIEYVEEIEEKIAELLADNHIVARVAGKMEWGARALGNRSLLANPSSSEVVKEINERMKKRDFWMPFTPTVLQERESDYLVNPNHIRAPYMILAFQGTELAKKDLRAAMHPYDYTVRPQVLEPSWNPRYYKLIKSFERRTGIGAVLNTSFNLHGLPIVLGPKEAMHAFENSDLKYLALENYLLSKI